MAKRTVPQVKAPVTPGLDTFYVEIEGTTPLMHHRFTESEEIPNKSRRMHTTKSDPRTVAENLAYRTVEGQLYMPGTAISRLLREAGAGHKERSSRRSLKYIIPACVLMSDDIIPLRNGDGRSPATEFEVDSRPVVIPSTKGRIMRHRPRLNVWSGGFHLEIDSSMIDVDMVHQLLVEGGSRLGIGDFRPEKGGPYGRFRVILWRPIEQPG